MKCSCKTNFNEQKIEQILLNEFNIQLKKHISDFEYKQKNYKKMNFSKEISSLENKLNKLKDLYIRDLIRIEDYEKDYKEYVTQLETLYAEQEKIDTNIPNSNLDNLKSFLSNDFISKYRLLSRIEKRRIWLSIIDYITLDKDYNMKIFFI